ncbi:MAG TPA: hypothetical protein VNX88_12340 [Terriglobales bacterium]|jgi:hypothetical protein|nr:hypothetical protein [Terriglobales bacterium]
MPIIEVERKQPKNQIKASIESDVQDRLRAYCRYSGATNDQVVSGALKFLFQSDAEFKPWYEAHKNDAHPRRGPRKRIPNNGTENAATPMQDKGAQISALKK